VRRPRGDDGNALVEFTYLAVLLMVPLVYVLLTVFLVQRASFGVTEAARQAGRAYVTADDDATGRARARAAARLALDDQGIACDDCAAVSAPDGVAPGAAVDVRVRYFVRLPVVGAFFRGERSGIPVTATHVEYVDRFKAAG
jgi:Flp pilus assembly protein TadG